MQLCAWCLSDFRYVDGKTADMKPLGHQLNVVAETIMIAPAAGFYSNPALVKKQVRLAYVLCKEDLQRALLILQKAIEDYNHAN